MNSTIAVIPTDELRAIVAEEVSKAIERAHRSARERIGIDGMAARLGVSSRTICNWLKQPGKLPARRAGQQWLLSDVEAWERNIALPKHYQ